MELKITFCPSNRYPLRGLFIKASSVVSWLNAFQELKLRLSDLKVYPIPGNVANSVSGCAVIFHKEIGKDIAGRYEMLQQVSPFLFIAERSTLFPELNISEIEKLFHTNKHVFHPDFGLVELLEEVNFLDLLAKPTFDPADVITPRASVWTPTRIRSFYVHPLSPEEVLNNLTEKVFPKHEEFKDKPLTLFERLKLGVYSLFFKKKRTRAGSGPTEETGLASRLKKFFKSEKWERLEKDFEDLDKRNQKQVDKLVDLLRDNPEEALKYAIPLDPEGVGRGKKTGGGGFVLSARWLNFSLFGNAPGGSGTIDLGDHFQVLLRQYHATAEELIKKKEYDKAAFVYMKLLKQYRRAAEVMEQGNHYAEAATIYLKHSHDKLKAAQCYEKGKMTMEAIGLYKELADNEKVGDLFMSINSKTAAMQYYEEAAIQLKSKNQYIKASILYKEKMDESTSAQVVLLEGWKENKDAINCLNYYFSNIDDDADCLSEIHNINNEMVVDANREDFLKVMHHQFEKKKDLRDELREKAFEIIAAHVAINPSVVVELTNFNPQNKEIGKDALRFKLKNRKT